MVSESFSEFKDSFSYGTRTDLNFKFLKTLSEEDAAEFFRGLLEKLGHSLDDGNTERLIDHVVQAQVLGYSNPTNWVYDDGPITTLAKPVSETRIGLLTSTGHFVAGQDPEPFGIKNMSQEEATARINEFLKMAPELSEIPLGTDAKHLRVRHGGYDIRGVIADRNVALPLDRMREMDAAGSIGMAVSPAYSFVGATAQQRLLSQSGPVWVEKFLRLNIEGMILVPV